MPTLRQALLQAVETPFHALKPAGIGAAFVFPADFMGFAGHFPGNPILPGIVQIMAGALTAGQGRDLPLRGVPRCKFLRPVVPGERLEVTALPTGDGKWKVSLNTDGQACAEMLLLLGDAI